MERNVTSHAKSKADPEIVRSVGDVSRPHAPVRVARDLGHLPGESGLWAGVKSVHGLTRYGRSYLRGQADCHGPIFRHMFGADPAVFIAEPDMIWNFLHNEDAAWSSALVWTHFFHGLFPAKTCDGLLHLDFQPHRNARELLQPAFNAAALAGYLADAQRIYERTVTGWLARGRIPFKAEVRRLFAMVSAKIFMGIDDPAQAALLDRAMADGWQAPLALRKRKTLSLRWRRAKRGYALLWDALRPRIEERRTGADLLSRICRAGGAPDWVDADARARLFIAIMFGAFDTASSGMASMAYLIARHPRWQDELRAEACALPEGRPDPEALKTLERTDWVWKETLRLFPVAGFIARQALRETRLGEYRIPPATLVCALTDAAMHDPKWWSSPETFDPERFSPARAEEKHHKAIFLPFGAGAHACIGAQLANLEVRAFWHTLLRRCRIRLSPDYQASHRYLPLGTVSGDVTLELSPLDVCLT